jgi:hypothetical protein
MSSPVTVPPCADLNGSPDPSPKGHPRRIMLGNALPRSLPRREARDLSWPGKVCPGPEVERPVKLIAGWLVSRPGLRLFAVVAWERSTWSARSTPVFGRARTNDVDRDEPPSQP